MAKKKRKIVEAAPVAADLFCGSGSVSAALVAAGFDVAFAIDNDASAKETYQLNHPGTDFFAQDIQNVSLSKAEESLGERDLSVLAVCAPCQPFSNQNRKRGRNDDRTDLVLEALRFIRVLEPKTVWLENVPGIVHSNAIRAVRGALEGLGYDFGEPLKVSATDFGVPQKRVRSIFVASKDDNVIKRVDALRSNETTEHAPTVRMAFHGLAAVGSGEQCDLDPLHRARKHTTKTIERLKAIPKDGGSRSSLPFELQLACHRELAANSYPDVYGRMAWDAPAPTLTTGCTDVTRGRFAHPSENRAITLREAARLQTFPDTYRFDGSSTEISRLIGNAVPYEMARRIFDYLFFDRG